MEELEKELNRRGLEFPRATGVMLGSPDFDIDRTTDEMRVFVAADT